MKKLIILVVSMILSASTMHAAEVPEAVKKAFTQKFPTVTNVKWEKENGTEYEASFVIDSKEMSALYTATGALKEIETEIPVADLPQAVVDSVNKKYPNAKIKEAARIDRSDNSVLFEAEIRVGGKKTDILFDGNGNAVN
ncbi:MAG: PepSY-like domain-containing protein [Bacteroidetes bacterium]|nr:PepSY-like domain-containing protein [Bacteroidota bacterium]